MNIRAHRQAQTKGRLEVLRRWIASLPADSKFAIELAEEYRQSKITLSKLLENGGDKR